MRKATKIWLIIAGSLVLAGCIILAVLMSTLKLDFTKLSTVKFETNNYEINETFNDISVTTDTADIIFALSDDGKCKIKCYEEENAKHPVTVEGNTLVVKIDNRKSWYDYIGIYIGSPKLTVYLPKAEYNTLTVNDSTGSIEIPKDFSFEDADFSSRTGDIDFFATASKSLKLKTTTGNIRVENASAGSIDLSVSTGMVNVSDVTCRGDITVNVSTGRTNLSDISCQNIFSNGTTGSIYLNNVIATNKFSIDRSTGDIKFKNCDAAKIYAETDTGDITGNLLTDKIFNAESSTGKIDVPKTKTGGICEIKTATGDIKVTTE